MAVKSNTVRIRTTGSNMGLFRIVLISSIGIISIILLIKLIRKGRAVSSANRADTDVNVQLATMLNSAIHPARSFVGDLFTGADKSELFSLAKQINKQGNFHDVATEYYRLYEESLTHEVQDALGRDYQQFLNIISGEGITPTTANNLAKKLYDAYKGLTGLFVYVSSNEVATIQEYTRLTDSDQQIVQAAYNSMYNRNLASDLMEVADDLTPFY
jgi:hypothetical protein